MNSNELEQLINVNKKKICQDNYLYKPKFFNLSKQDEHNALFVLLSEKPFIKVYDPIESQLRELVKCRTPNRILSEQEIALNISELTQNIDLELYGLWVYYEWNEKLVHILNENEFIELRTSRNKYKITHEEQIVLSKKKIGVIGLSVGQSVSITLAIERGFGELRIADFDELELTNLNRLRCGIYNLGLKKTVIVAREIAEIDPFLNVICFHDGIHDENMESFLIDNGKLDVLIDECDGVDIKLKCRIAAKKFHIPVLMEASDRGTVDVERFDIEPQRPILHGFVEHLDVSNFHTLKTNEQKLPYLLAFAGIETLSKRMKASAVEVGQTISTWPQLASAVTMGGGITADVCRRILLDGFHNSGRYFIDIEELIGDTKHKSLPLTPKKQELNIDEMRTLSKRVEYLIDENAFFDNDIIESLVKAAQVAPSAGNNQPWKWYNNGKQLLLFLDKERAFSYGDFNYMATFMAFGTALENIKLRAADFQLKMNITLSPLGDSDVLIAALQFFKDKDILKDDLVNYLNIRYTNRRKGTSIIKDKKVFDNIAQSISSINDIELKLITDDILIKKIADITGKAEKLRMFIPQGHYELFEKEIRWTPGDAQETRDGLDIRTLDLESKDAIGFRVIRDPEAIKLVAEWNKGEALENMTKKLVTSASAVGLIIAKGINIEDCIRTGTAAQRIWLTASKNNIAMQPTLAAVLHFARLNQGNGIDMPADIRIMFEDLYQEFTSIFKIAGGTPMFLFRLFSATEPVIRSLRLKMEDIYFFE